MNLSEYQPQALATAKPTALNMDGYLLPGIVSEVGEVFGKIAKHHRDGWQDGRLQSELAAEWGDVAWMTAVALRLEEIDQETPGVAFQHEQDAVQALAECAVEALIASPNSHRRGALIDVWEVLRDGSEVVTGLPFSEVLVLNLTKLADRADRNVIEGSGDHR